MDGIHAYRQKIKTKVYGINSTKDVRKQLIDLLMDRVQYHKDKFISPIIYQELCGMQVKKNGKIEHSDSTHDDQIFSLLMALYVWYNGTNLAERYGLKRTSIQTDEDVSENVDYFDPETMSIVEQFNTNSEIDDITEQTNKKMSSLKVELMGDYLNRIHEEEQQQFYDLINTDLGAKAYKEKYNIPQDVKLSAMFGQDTGNGLNRIPDKVFDYFYSNPINSVNDLNSLNNNGAVPESAAFTLEDESYRYFDHFNF